MRAVQTTKTPTRPRNQNAKVVLQSQLAEGSCLLVIAACQEFGQGAPPGSELARSGNMHTTPLLPYHVVYLPTLLK